MSLQQWAEHGWLRPHRTSRQEIRDQLAAAARDLADARGDISADWRFAIAYNAALRLCTLLLYASGYEATREQKHYRTIAAVPLVLGPDASDLAVFLDGCRVKRSDVTYESAQAISDAEVEELLGEVKRLQRQVRNWLQASHRDLIG